jgi:tetratricopeptide (TPR) repeat protein
MIILKAAGIYWGERGEYGPFDEQQTGEWAGWPDFGQVLRYFREKAGMDPSEFAALYGKHTKPDGGPISGRQVTRMECENEVPSDMNRRKLIARLLNIPPNLFGLAILQDITLRPHPQLAGASTLVGHSTLAKVKVDTIQYQKNIQYFLALYQLGQTQSELNRMSADIRDLESLEEQSRGDLQYHVWEILFSYYLLAAKAVRDQRNYRLSHYYANHAVRVAKGMQDTDLIATATYVRGRTHLEWGMGATLKRGVFEIHLSEIEKAIRDFEDAKKAAEHTDKKLHPQLIGLIDTRLSRAYAVRSMTRAEEVPPEAIALLESTEEKADSQPIHDPFERELLTGEQVGFVRGSYHIDKARTLVVMGKPDAAREELAALEGLQNGRVGQQFIRRHAWIDTVAAYIYVELGEFDEAIKRANRALTVVSDIKSENGIISIIDVHGRLAQSSYKTEHDVHELGVRANEALTSL